MDEELEIIENLYNRIRAVGSNVHHVCDEAGVTPQAFYSWKRGDSSPILGKFYAVVRVVEKYEREKYDKERHEELEETVFEESSLEESSI